MKADTFRARLRLGLGFAGAVHVPETLKLCDGTVPQLCDTLCVDGDLDLAGCTNLQQLPERLIVRGKLALDGCVRLEHLPSTIHELFGLSAAGCTALKSIAPLPQCHGLVTLVGCSAMEPLPADFRAELRVCLDGCNIHPSHIELAKAIPETLLLALPGKRLGNIIDHRLLARHQVRDAFIETAGPSWCKTKIVLRGDFSSLVTKP